MPRTGARCQGCGTADWGHDNNIFLFCDGCELGWHRACAQVLEVPEGPWYCSECREKRRHDPPKRDAAGLRKTLGMSTEGDGTAADTELIRSQGAVQSTKARRSRLQDGFEALRQRRGLGLDQEALEAWATKRVIDNVGAATIKQDNSMLKALYPEIKVNKAREREFLKGVVTMATPKDGAKLGLTLGEYVQLMDQIAAQQFPKSKLPAGDQERRKLRDRTFFAVCFAGITRGAELAKLEWTHLRGLWAKDGKEPEERAFDHVEPGAKLVGVKIYLLDTKTDREKTGQMVTLTRRPSLSPEWSPVALLERLFLARRPGEAFVFEKLDGSRGHVQATSFRSAFKKLMRAVVSPERLNVLSLHSFRKGGTTLAVKEGAAPEIVNAQGRWRDPTTCLEFYTVLGDTDRLAFSDTVLAALGRHLADR